MSNIIDLDKKRRDKIEGTIKELEILASQLEKDNPVGANAIRDLIRVHKLLNIPIP